MDIPESISNLTTTTQNDKFNPAQVRTKINFDEMLHNVRSGLEYKDLTSLDEGLAYFKKDISNERTLIKSLISLVIDHLTRCIRTGAIDESSKDQTVSATVQAHKGAEALLESYYTLLTTLNKEKNIIDVRKLSLIILGYAIGTFKKIHNS